MSLQSLYHGTILDILGLAHEFGFIELEISISDYLQKILNVRNVCFVLDASRFVMNLIYLIQLYLLYLLT